MVILRGWEGFTSLIGVQGRRSCGPEPGQRLLMPSRSWDDLRGSSQTQGRQVGDDARTSGIDTHEKRGTAVHGGGRCAVPTPWTSGVGAGACGLPTPCPLWLRRCPKVQAAPHTFGLPGAPVPALPQEGGAQSHGPQFSHNLSKK